MNLVGGYDSSSSDEDESKNKQHSATIEPPKGKGKARAYPAAVPAQASTAKQQQQQPTEDASKKNRKGRSSCSSSSKKKKKKKTATKRKKESKRISALVLSPEIQAALARGETLADSDSDDDAPDKKPPKIIRRPAGSDPNDLLSLLPQPSTAASADDILLKNRKKREDAKTAKSEGTAAAAAAVSTAPASTKAAPAPAPASVGVGGGVGDDDEPDQESDSDDGGDDLLAGMHAKSAAAAGSDSGARSGPLFTLPSRARPPPEAVATDLTLPGEEVEAVGAVPSAWDDTAAAAAAAAVAAPGYPAPDRRSAGQQWGATDGGHPMASPHGGYGEVGAGGGAQYATYGATSGQQQQQQPSYYQPATAQAAAGFGGAVQHGAGAHEAEFGGGGGGGKATRRKGRDMERALARGDLGALGSELPVMDLHQGSNEYNPLRTKPVTAAMKQDQKHIESSVYDPSTGKTVRTLEPTSTQKRKHQINQLAVQAASMERDLMERSGASRLTKAQTHAKYGW